MSDDCNVGFLGNLLGGNSCIIILIIIVFLFCFCGNSNK